MQTARLVPSLMIFSYYSIPTPVPVSRLNIQSPGVGCSPVRGVTFHDCHLSTDAVPDAVAVTVLLPSILCTAEGVTCTMPPQATACNQGGNLPGQ